MTAGVFVVTDDLMEYLVRSAPSMTGPVRAGVRQAAEELAAGLAAYVPSRVTYAALKVVNVRQQVDSQLPSWPVVTLDETYVSRPDYHVPMTAATVVGRRILAGRNQIDPADAISRIRERSVCVVDSGAKSGWTILEFTRLLSTYGIKVEHVVLGLASPRAIARIREQCPVTAMNLFDIHEWVELRDLYCCDESAIKGRVQRYRFAYSKKDELASFVAGIILRIHELIYASVPVPSPADGVNHCCPRAARASDPRD